MSKHSTSQLALAAATIDLEHSKLEHIKQAAPNWSAALPGALIGALGMGGIQGIRRLFASDRDKREGRAPSILNGLLLGALGGGGLSMGMPAIQKYLQGLGRPEHTWDVDAERGMRPGSGGTLRGAPGGTLAGGDSKGPLNLNAIRAPEGAGASLYDSFGSSAEKQTNFPAGTTLHGSPSGTVGGGDFNNLRPINAKQLLADRAVEEAKAKALAQLNQSPTDMEELARGIPGGMGSGLGYGATLNSGLLGQRLKPISSFGGGAAGLGRIQAFDMNRFAPVPGSMGGVPDGADLGNIDLTNLRSYGR